MCTDNTSVRGLFIEVGIWNENAARQSFHPNDRGHGMFAQCITAVLELRPAQATCVDPASTGSGVLYPGLMEFKQLRNLGHRQLRRRQGLRLAQQHRAADYTCHGGRNQGFWYDPARRRCTRSCPTTVAWTSRAASMSTGTEVNIYDCHGGAAQQLVFAGNQIKPAAQHQPLPGVRQPVVRAPRGCGWQNCSSSTRQQWSFETRTFANPVGYGHDDFIGSRVY